MTTRDGGAHWTKRYTGTTGASARSAPMMRTMLSRRSYGMRLSADSELKTGMYRWPTASSVTFKRKKGIAKFTLWARVNVGPYYAPLVPVKLQESKNGKKLEDRRDPHDQLQRVGEQDPYGQDQANALLPLGGVCDGRLHEPHDIETEGRRQVGAERRALRLPAHRPRHCPAVRRAGAVLPPQGPVVESTPHVKHAVLREVGLRSLLLFCGQGGD